MVHEVNLHGEPRVGGRGVQVVMFHDGLRVS